ncbi:iron complex outermembrane receptor protein [Novosphingobium sp. PhB165]|uniref:TonB-dependent receptor plug domain-containing protein n=1 Tax=Novosphingobium sp. PhB165 TaxID=2485105 RepID=UPI0010485264|nr:TonB-dependent receptor [Novosphingobium sp. PhB165]TCM15341.1 iron complex outermembrane receptor protein [Novosphingobium sp. PhB165]
MKRTSSPVRRYVLLGVSMIALAPVAALAQTDPAPDQDSQTTLSDKEIKEIIVTGTLLRGVAPAGSETVSINSEAITAIGANSTAQLLASVPQAASFNTTPIVSAINSSQITINRPNLRNLPGASGGGSSTLILVDGHRLPGMGVRQTVPDPDAIAPGAIERVEIVLDGGSSIYGADAVGGVINFITRKRFDGIEVKGRYGFESDYQSANADVTVGKTWDSLSVYASYDYSWHDSLYGRDRDFVRRLDYTTGLPLDLTCGAGNVSIGSSIYALPGLTLGTGNRCDISQNRTFYPSETRHSVFAGMSYDDGGPVTFDMRAFYMNRVNKGDGGPVTATATIAPVNPYAPGIVLNPFYRNTGDANSFAPQSVSMDFSSILGDHTSQSTRLETWGFTPSATADLGHGWQLRWLANYGRGRSEVANQKIDDGTLSGLVLTGNFDPYNLSNPANSAVLPLISNFLDYGLGKNEMVNTRLVLDGSLFSLPGGDVKVAVGGEYSYEKYESRINGTVSAAAVDDLPFNSASRRIAALFGEVQVPVIGEGNRTGGFYSLSLSASGRYDHYSDFGGTFNPKFGATYEPFDGLKIRGSWGKSFQAPSLADGADAAPPTIFAFPLILFANPAVAPLPGQAQIFLGGGGTDLKPQKATTWSIGMDIAPPSVPGLALTLNYYNIRFKNLIDIPPVFNPSVFYSLFTSNYVMNPTIAQVNALASQVPGGLAQVSPYTVVPGQVYSIADGRRTNLAAVNTDGLDVSLSYDHQTGFGSVYTQINGNYVLDRKEQSVSDAPFVNTVKAQTRFILSSTLGATFGNLRAQATWRHLGGWDVAPLASNLNQSRIKDFDTINLFAQYDFKGTGVMKDLSLTFNVDNLFDKDPPPYNGSINSLDGYAVTSIGRVFQFGISKKF